MIHLSNFPKRLKKLREEKGLTMAELSREIGAISQASLSHYETGTRKPGLDILMELANFFNCSLDYLSGKTDYKNQEELIKKYHLEGKGIEEVIKGLQLYEESNLSIEEVENFVKMLNTIKEI